MASELRRNKWYKHQLLMNSPALARFLPKSYRYSPANLSKMLNLYPEIILKPVVGSGGVGIIKVSKGNEGVYHVHTLGFKQKVTGRDSLVPLINRLTGKRSFLIQYCIPLAKVGGKLIDFRYIVQRSKGDSKWIITGKHAKIGKEGYVVTNLQQGANVETVRRALQQANIKNIGKTMADLDYLSLQASKVFSRTFGSQTIWGYDLAVDVNGKVWMIEANCTPLVGGFRYLQNQSMYRTIRRYQAMNR
ncbi:YheC/YheD family protein [Paenibacillus harenae]|uniref:YheC/YheD family protein n=1 Tax=Paenibacillus harenae TaxID=306543 RepID=UPI00278E9301|nr:YheC/YheD family protein [Paenibacillus harenae]MDQ0061704.1 glutathione synthase/RimK-type ligase-like ATP-grasp enzyme [Paenibacillus harenae]